MAMERLRLLLLVALAVSLVACDGIAVSTSQAQAPIPGSVWALHTAHDGAIFAGTSVDGVYLSTDAGHSFHPVGAPDRHVWDVIEVGDALLAAVEQGPLMISVDGNAPFSMVNVVPGGAHGYDLAHHAGSPHVYLATWGRGVFRAPVNHLTSWTNVSANLPEPAVTAIDFDPSTGSVIATVFGNGTWRQAAGESAWFNTSTLGGHEGWSVVSQCDNFYVGTWGGGIYRSSNDGVSFAHVGLDGLIVYDLARGPGCFVYAATSNGLYRAHTSWSPGQWEDLGFTGEVLYSVTVRGDGVPCAGSPFGWVGCGMPPVASEGVGFDEQLALAAPYPNPLSGGQAANIRFSLPQAGSAAIAIYDMLGRIVEQVADGEFASGTHQVRWNPAGLAAGVYILRLAVGGEVVTRRLVVH